MYAIYHGSVAYYIPILDNSYQCTKTPSNILNVMVNNENWFFYECIMF